MTAFRRIKDCGALQLISVDSASDVKLLTGKLFKSNEKAETFGFKMGRAWADEHLLDNR